MISSLGIFMGQDQAVESQKWHSSMTTNLGDCPPRGVLCPPLVVQVLLVLREFVLEF